MSYVVVVSVVAVVRQGVLLGRPGSSDRGTLQRIAQRFMGALSNLPQRVRAYFEDEQVAYASSWATYSVYLLG